MSSSTKTLDRVVLASISARTWSGAAKLRPGDVPGLSELPERAFSLGRKYLIAPEKLRPFTTLRRRAQERCLKIGTRFLGGFAVPDEDAVLAELEAGLEADAAEFEAAKEDLLRDLARSVDEWVSEPEVRPYEQLIRNAIPSPTEIGRRLSFGYSFTRIAAAGGEAAQERLEQQVEGLGESLIGELSQAARELHERLSDKTEGRPADRWVIAAKTIESVQAIRAKAMGLSFVDHRIGPIVGEIDRVLSTLPVGKQIKGQQARDFAALLAMLANEQALLDYARSVLDQREAELDANWEEMQAEKLAPAPTPESDDAEDTAAIDASLQGDMDFEDADLIKDLIKDDKPKPAPEPRPTVSKRPGAIGF